MIEVKNLCKTYIPKGKKAVSVKALDNVSLKFPDKGLIFILGKSGSGKSTLLNVMGGLDLPDSGEIIIKGKSSVNFKPSDFDSYRNTYLGFIFQEYNILEEFTIEKNISLALELQHKKVSDEEINSILKEVDLVSLNKRKPNELSGGQKQRVAIARALVKHPEIIFADEPTGALDSNTGKAVFDTLKKLSKDHLVVVVSHDRDFAEQFGDRVIELKDGQVISDIEKHQVLSEFKRDGFNIVDNNVIQIKKGYKVTDEDIKLIIDKIKANDQEKYIVMDDIIAPQVRQISNIDDSGNREAFAKTDESAIINKQDKFKLIKSKLGFKNSLKIGASALKVKPFRLFLTVLLGILSFSMFGVVDCLSAYNRNDATIESLLDSGIQSFAIRKSYSSKNGNYNQLGNYFSDNEVKQLNEKFDISAQPTNKSQMFGDILRSNLIEDSDKIPFYSPQNQSNTSLVSYMNDEMFKDSGFTMLSGELPDSNNEVALTEYQLAVVNNAGYLYSDGSNETKIEAGKVTAKDIVGKKLKIDKGFSAYGDFIVTGVIDTGFMNNDNWKTRYKILLEENGNSNLEYYNLYNEFSNLLQTSYYNTFFLSEDYCKYLFNDKMNTNLGQIIGSLKFTIGDIYCDYNPYYIYLDSYNIANLKYLNGKTSLNADEYIGVSASGIISDINAKYIDVYEPLLKSVNLNNEDNTVLNTYIKNSTLQNYTMLNLCEDNDLSLALYINSHKDGILNSGFKPSVVNLMLNDDVYSADSNGNFLNDYDFMHGYRDYLFKFSETNQNIPAPYDDEFVVNELINYKNPFVMKLVEYEQNDLINLPEIEFTINAETYTNNGQVIKTYTRKVGAVFFSKKDNNNQMIVSKDDTLSSMLSVKYDSFDDVGKYESIIVPTPSDKSKLMKIVDFHYKNVDDQSKFYQDDSLTSGNFYMMDSVVFSTLNMVNSMFSVLKNVFLYLGLALGLFTCLMLFNFISTSISYKKREIGILRAVGARGADVFAIFFNESAIIVGFDVLISSIVSIVTCVALNNFFRSSFNLLITILNPGIRQVLLILAVGIVTALISTTLPVLNASKKKPIDAIHNK